MDLPSCPSCKQSVLDDDAENCPFCGAALKGGAARPGASGPVKPTARPAAPARPAPATQQPARPSRPTGLTQPVSKAAPVAGEAVSRPAGRPHRAMAEPPEGGAGDEDLFALGAAGATVTVSRQRSQSKSHRVTCPMCETSGYVPVSAAGKEVRCANPKCLVPVFLAPKVEKKVAEEARSKSGFPAWAAVLVAILVAAGGAGGWYATHRPAAPKPNPPNPPQTGKARPSVVAPKKDNAVAVVPKETDKPPAAPAEKPLLLSEEREPVLGLIAKASQDHDRNRSIEFCERVTAQTAAEVGDVKMARQFLEPLLKGSQQLGFYSVAPLTAIAWHELKGKDAAGAGKDLDSARQYAEELPTVGRDSIDASCGLAAALAAAGREKDAQALVARFPAAGSTGRLFVVLQTAMASRSWDVEAASRERPLLDVASFQGPAVAELAVARGYPAETLRFVESLGEPSQRIECTIAWIDAVLRAKPSDPAAAAALAKLPPAARARALARTGMALLRTKDRAGAEKSLADAVAALGKVAAGEEFVVPSLKDLATLDLADPSAARQTAMALAEIARLEGALNLREAGQGHLMLSLSVLRASAPASAAIEERLKDLSKRFGAVRSDLIKILKLKNDSQVIAAVNKYRRNCKTLLDRAEARMALEVEILQSALAWDDPIALWEEIDRRAADANPERREPYFTTIFPAQLAAQLDKSGNGSLAAKIRKAGSEHATPPAALLTALADAAARSEVNGLAKEIEAVQQPEKADVEWAVLVSANRLVREGRIADALQFVRMLKDQLLKEEALLWVAAQTCREGKALKVKPLLADANFLPAEAVMAWRGYLLGLAAREEAAAAARPAKPGPKPAEKPGRR